MTTLKATPLEATPLEDGKALEELDTGQLIHVMVRVQRARHAAVADLENLAAEYAEYAKAAKEATETHARAFLRHDGPGEERTQTAKLAAASAVFMKDAAKEKINACKARLDVLKDDWDTCRSANSNERALKSATDGWGS